MASTTHDILLRFITEQSSKQKTEQAADSLNKKLEETEKHVHDINQAGHDAGLVRAMDEAAKIAKEKLNPALDQAVKKEKELAAATKQAAHEAHLQMKIFDAQSMILSGQASLLTKRASELTRISSSLGQFSRLGLGAGVGIVGGVLAEANRYAKEAEGADKATRATREWTQATRELAEAHGRVDQVLIREALPLIQQAAQFATQAAEVVEQHPEIVQAALNTGKILIALSAVGLVASKGIKLVADAKYLAAVPIQLRAAELQIAAAQQMLVAAQLQADASGTEVAGGLGKGRAPLTTGGGLAKGAITVLAPVIGATIADQIFDAIEGKDFKFADYVTEVKQGTALFAKGVGDLAGIVTGDKTLGLKWFEKAANALGLLEKKAEQVESAIAGMGLAGSENEKEIVSAFEDWKKDDARIVAEAAEQRVKIVADAEKRVTAETARNAARVASINASAAKRAESLASNFLKAGAKAEASYQEQRAKVIRDGGKEVRKIEEDHQERLRKLILEHEERVEDLTASRDALGLAKEARRFNEVKAEEARGVREEIAQRRADLAERLQELDREHKIEQAQRLAQFQEALAENEAQRKEELKQAAIAHAEELKQIREQRAAQLRELVETLNAERLRRREMFIAQVRDLDASLLGERNLKVRYYNLMLSDADRWLAAYRTKLASAATATAPTHDFTGYAYSGLYRMAANGQPEYVLSGAATRAAEKIIGGRLTQDAMLTAMVRGAAQGGSRTLTYNDQRRFNASVPLSERRAIVRETADAIAQEFRR